MDDCYPGLILELCLMLNDSYLELVYELVFVLPGVVKLHDQQTFPAMLNCIGSPLTLKYDEKLQQSFR